MNTSLTYYQELAEQALLTGTAVLRPWSDVIRVPIINGTNETVRVGRLLSLMGISNDAAPFSFWISLQVAGMIATRDFNNRLSPFSKRLTELTLGCDFYMTMSITNSRVDPGDASRAWVNNFLYGLGNDQINPNVAYSRVPVVSSNDTFPVAPSNSVSRNDRYKSSPVNNRSSSVLLYRPT
eukprot:Pompholyxophrys_punicea_v1_NODE_185_length_2913_cov_3.717985.p4 type:complete len:181 gc:universal NODE_185_length_2913_cov_3.717985:1461-919(-)